MTRTPDPIAEESDDVLNWVQVMVTPESSDLGGECEEASYMYPVPTGLRQFARLRVTKN